MSQEKTCSKCIYCQTELTKRNRSKEHVVNKSILPKHNDKLTLIKKVCRKCNHGFEEIDRALAKNTIIGFNRTVMDIINNEDRWDNSQEPFKIKNLSTTIRGDKQVFTVETNEEQEKNMLRGIAKIALNALIYDFKGEKSKFIKDKSGNCHCSCASYDDTFNGDEEALSNIKKFIKEGGNSPIYVERKGTPLQVYDQNMNIQGENIPMQKITDPMHVIGIYKIQSYYYAVMSFFIGMTETPPLFFVPLIGDIIGDINEIDTDSVDPEGVRIYNFGYLVKKELQQEPVTSHTIEIANGSSPCIITPVNALEWIRRTNMSKNSSALQKYLELEYQRRT